MSRSFDPGVARRDIAALAEAGAVTRRRRLSGLGWALGISAALHLLAGVTALEWRDLTGRPPPAALVPDVAATVEVVMGDSAETNGAASPPPPPAPPPVPATPQAEPAPTLPPPAPAAEAAAPAAPPPAGARGPDKPSWQSGATLGDGMVGAAELAGDRLRPAVGNRGNIPPGYPHLAATLGQQGLVVLRMTIGADGQVTAVEVLESSGYARLDQAALAALAKWRFTPAVINGVPVESEQVLPVRFRLN